MNLKDLAPIAILALTLYLTIKDLVIPLVKKRMNNNKNITLDLGNPGGINVDRLYQEFKDFKENQGKWNEKMERRWEKQDERVDNLERRK